MSAWTSFRRRVSSAAFVLAFAVLPCAAATLGSPADDAACSGAAGETREVGIRGTAARFRIPSAYIRSPALAADGENVDALYLIALLPDLLPARACDEAALHERGAPRLSLILIVPQAALALRQRAETYSALPSSPAEVAGLAWVDLRNGPHPSEYSADLFLPAAPHHPDFFIVCSERDQHRRAPRCRLYFDVDGVSVDSDFPRSELARYADILSSLHALLDGWRLASGDPR